MNSRSISHLFYLISFAIGCLCSELELRYPDSAKYERNRSTKINALECNFDENFIRKDSVQIKRYDPFKQEAFGDNQLPEGDKSIPYRVAIDTNSGFYICFGETQSGEKIQSKPVGPKFINDGTLIVEEANVLKSLKELEYGVDLKCLLTITDPKLLENSTLLDKFFIWTFKGRGSTEKEIKSGDKYEFLENRQVLRIKNPSFNDIGDYTCDVNPAALPNAEKSDQLIENSENLNSKKSITLNFEPYVPALLPGENSNSIVEFYGDNITFYCNASAFPHKNVAVEWRFYKTQDANKTEMSSRVNITRLDANGTTWLNSSLQIVAMQFEDEGYYECHVGDSILLKNDSSRIYLRVIDKLAPLWPFLCIIAEVVVLVLIILIYERRRSSKNAEALNNLDDDDNGDEEAGK